MSRRAVLPATRPEHRNHLVRAVSTAGADTVGPLELVSVCTELTHSIGGDDLAEAMVVVATVAGCPTVLLRPDRTVLMAGEPRTGRTLEVTAVRPHMWRWTANGPQSDRELPICAGTRRLGILAFLRPVPDRELSKPVWGVVQDLLALALLGRDANRRAAAAELQATLFACLSDEDPHHPPAVVCERTRYRPAIISPVTPEGVSAAGPFGRLNHRIGEEPLLAAGRSAGLEDRTVYLYPEPKDCGPRDHARAWHRVLAGAAPLRFRVAIGLPDERGPGLRESYRTTRWLADLQAAPAPGLRVEDVAVVDELGVVAGALGPGWGPRLGHFVRRVLGDMVDNPRFGGEMVDTLHAYLVCGRSPNEASRLLHLSPSSMKYRMRVIRETLGDRLDDHDSAFEIELALRLLKAFEGRRTDADAQVRSW